MEKLKNCTQKICGKFKNLYQKISVKSSKGIKCLDFEIFREKSRFMCQKVRGLKSCNYVLFQRKKCDYKLKNEFMKKMTVKGKVNKKQ